MINHKKNSNEIPLSRNSVSFKLRKSEHYTHKEPFFEKSCRDFEKLFKHKLLSYIKSVSNAIGAVFLL